MERPSLNDPLWCALQDAYYTGTFTNLLDSKRISAVHEVLCQFGYQCSLEEVQLVVDQDNEDIQNQVYGVSLPQKLINQFVK